MRSNAVSAPKIIKVKHKFSFFFAVSITFEQMLLFKYLSEGGISALFPQLGQNTLPSGSSFPHLLQNISIPSKKHIKIDEFTQYYKY